MLLQRIKPVHMLHAFKHVACNVLLSAVLRHVSHGALIATTHSGRVSNVCYPFQYFPDCLHISSLGSSVSAIHAVICLCLQSTVHSNRQQTG